MGVSKQTTFVVTCALVLSAVVPGAAGYLSGRLEAVERAEYELRVRQALLETRERDDGLQGMSVPAGLCGGKQRQRKNRRFGGRKVSRPQREFPAALAPPPAG